MLLYQWNLSFESGTPESETILLGIVDSVSPRPPYLPLAVPKDLADRISRLHGDPAVWWVGQFLKYLLRPQPSTVNMLKDAATQFKFDRPIVGLVILFESWVHLICLGYWNIGLT